MVCQQPRSFCICGHSSTNRTTSIIHVSIVVCMCTFQDEHYTFVYCCLHVCELTWEVSGISDCSSRHTCAYTGTPLVLDNVYFNVVNLQPNDLMFARVFFRLYVPKTNPNTVHCIAYTTSVWHDIVLPMLPQLVVLEYDWSGMWSKTAQFEEDL